MKKIFILLLIAATPFAAFHYAKKYSEDSQYAAKFFVYSQEVESPAQLFLRDIPSRYEPFFKVERIQPFTGDLAMYRVNSNLPGGMPDIHYIVENKQDHSLQFLKSRFLLRKIPVSISKEEIDSYFIDFHQFVRCVPKRCDTEEFVTRFAKLLCDDPDKRKFRRIKLPADIDSIRLMYRKQYYRCSQPLISGNDFIRGLGKDEFLFWYFDRGIVKFTANKFAGNIQSVSSRRLGFSLEAHPVTLGVLHE